MRISKKRIFILVLIFLSPFVIYKLALRTNFNTKYQIGEPLDSLTPQKFKNYFLLPNPLICQKTGCSSIL